MRVGFESECNNMRVREV